MAATIALATLMTGWPGTAARADVQIDGLAETTPTTEATEATQGFLLRGSATWPTSDADYLRRSLPVLPTVAQLGLWHSPAVDFKRSDRVSGGRLEFSEFVAESPLWVRRLSDTALLSMRFNYEYTSLDTGVPGLGGALDLHRLELPLSVSWNPGGSPWRVFTRVSVTAKTDFDASWGDAVGYTALTGVFRRVSDSLSLGVGGYYAYSMGEHQFIPGAGFVWAPNDRFSAGLVGPWLTTSWRLSDDWRVRLEGRWRSSEWAVGDTALGGEDTQVELRNVRAVAALERKLFEPFGSEAWLSLQAGYRFMTRLEVRDADRRELLREDVRDGMFFGVAIRVQL